MARFIVNYIFPAVGGLAVGLPVMITVGAANVPTWLMAYLGLIGGMLTSMIVQKITD